MPGPARSQGTTTRGLAAGATILACLVAPVRAGNFPPTARIGFSPSPARPGQAVQFVGSASTDPDGGPQPLAFAWDFGAGATSSLPDPVHAFATRGLHVVSLSVWDGEDSSVAVVRVPVIEAPAPGSPVASSPLSLSSDGSQLWVANEDSGTVTLVDTSALAATDEVAVAAGPVSVALSSDGATLFVACRDAGSVALVAVATRSLAGLVPVGRSPRGLVVVPGSGDVLVALEGEGAVRILPASDPAAQRTIVTGGRPHAVAVTHDGTRAVVTDFVASPSAGRAFVLDLTTERLDASAFLSPDTSLDTPSSGRGVPNLLASVALEPSGRLAQLGGLKSNVLRGLVRDGQPLLPTNRVRGLTLPVDPASGLEQVEGRIDLNDADSGSALAFSPDGLVLYVAHEGLGEVSAYDYLEALSADTSDGSAVPFAGRVPVGEAPRGIVLSGARAYVSNQLSRSVTVLDLADPLRPLPLTEVPVTAEPLPPRVANGQRAFHSSRRPRHSSQGYIACASCHPGGGHDGMTWDFTSGGEGLRNTIDLRGRAGTGHGPVHWSANFDEIQDFENDIVFAFGGTGLAGDGLPPNPPLGAPNAGRGEDLDDLAAFVATLDAVPPSPARMGDGTLSAAAQRGKGVFYSAEARCSSCHVPPRFTDSTLAADPAAFRLHDVGTIAPTSGQRLGGRLIGLDTPTLKLLWDGAPYLHDGRAATLLEVLADFNPADRHGKTSHLSGAQLDDLTEFLLSIDDGVDVLPDPPTAAPGEVAAPGSVFPLLVDKRGAWLHLSWGPVDGAETYLVARGEIGDFTSHRVEAGGGTCDTGGEVQFFDPDDLRDGVSEYHVVTARNALGEGPAGGTLPPRRSTPECP